MRRQIELKATERRRFLQQSLAVMSAAGIAPYVGSAMANNKPSDVTEWGWPNNQYEKIADKSIEWLKSKGWWPLQVAWNPLWSDGNVVLFTMMKYQLLQKRGIEAQFPEILTAGLMNEGFVPGRVQVAQSGSLGMLRLIDLKVPTAAIATYPAQREAFLVPLNSPLKKGMIDLKDQAVLGRPAVCGVTVGSSNHLGLLTAAKVLGLTEGRDFTVANVAPEDILSMPKGIDVTAIWEPNVIRMVDFLKNARILELVDNYKIFNGYSYLKGELEANAPDVIQAYADAFIEARLIARSKSDEVLEAFVAHPSQRGRQKALIYKDAQVHVLNPKPTINFPFEDTKGFWIDLEKFQADIMADKGILRRRYTSDDFKSIFRPEYLTKTFQKLGWAIPTSPPFVPDNWTGTAGKPPYPPYGLWRMQKQAFPEKGDLI